MGVMTGQQFVDEVRLALENRADASCTDANLLRWVNHAYWHMTYPTVHAFQAFKVTYDQLLLANITTYNLGAGLGYDVLGVRTVSYLASTAPTWSTTRAPMKPRSIRWYDRHVHANGPPRFYVIGEGTTMLVSPVPGTAENGHYARIRLWREAAALTLATTTEVPNYFDEVLALGGQAVAEYRLGYRDRARETLEHYAAMLNDPKQKDEIEGEDWGFESQMTSQPIMGVST